ncbi:MAG: 50S ribosomal protein L35 [Dehalococcoidales bacterium]|nr:50S ribosomal protein L35 [Dehalococcoidales bacterium]
MPKIKTHKGAQKRFSITGSGKIMRTKIGQGHLRVHKAKRAKGQFDEMIPLNHSDQKRIKRLLPYGV